MPRRGRPAQGHAPAEGVAQYDMAHLFVADAERRTQALGATRMVVEWLVNRRSRSRSPRRASTTRFWQTSLDSVSGQLDQAEETHDRIPRVQPPRLRSPPAGRAGRSPLRVGSVTPVGLGWRATSVSSCRDAHRTRAVSPRPGCYAPRRAWRPER